MELIMQAMDSEASISTNLPAISSAGPAQAPEISFREAIWLASLSRTPPPPETRCRETTSALTLPAPNDWVTQIMELLLPGPPEISWVEQHPPSAILSPPTSRAEFICCRAPLAPTEFRATLSEPMSPARQL